MHQRYLPKIFVLVAVLSLTACAAGPNELVGLPDPGGSVAGFWQGWWHGFISFFTFVASFFSDDVSIYEVHNNGTWYNLGYIFGLMAVYGGSGGEANRRRGR